MNNETNNDTGLPPPMTQEQINEHNERLFIYRAKETARTRLKALFDSVGANILIKYPEAEVKTWETQKAEAYALLAVTDPTIEDIQSLAPTILGITIVHKGEAALEVRIAQVIEKAQIVKANSDAFLAIGIFVNGIRARTDDLLEAATTPVDVYVLESSITDEVNRFKELYGL